MLEITVTFQRHDRTAARTENISLDLTLGEVRDAVQTLLGFPEKPRCRLVLYRTLSTIEDNWTLKEADIQQNDMIMLYPLVVWEQKNAKGHFAVHKAMLESNITSDTEATQSDPQQRLAISSEDVQKQPYSFSRVLAVERTKIFVYHSLVFLRKNLLDIIRLSSKLFFKIIKNIRLWAIGVDLKQIWKKHFSKPFIILLIGFLITQAWSYPEVEYPRLVWGLRLGIIKDAQGKNLSGENLEAANLTKVNMIGANLKGARLHQANFSDATLRKASLAGADLRGVNFSRADLTQANLNRANLLGANLRGANLKATKISDPETGKITAKLDDNVRLIWEIVNKSRTGRDLEKQKLDRFNLSYANLKDATLSRASLTWVDLSNANLEGATLYKADLTGTNLRGANLKGANLRGANLYKVKTDTSTICPNGKRGPCKF